MDEVEVVVQINGKVRAKLLLPAGASPEEMLAAARAHERIGSLLAGKTELKAFTVPDKLVNIVVK